MLFAVALACNDDDDDDDGDDDDDDGRDTHFRILAVFRNCEGSATTC
jgi:hypothetical protein